MLSDCHLSALPYHQAHIRGSRAAISYRLEPEGRWRDVDWVEFAERTRQVSWALLSLGVQPGEIGSELSENKPECLYVDFGAFGIRATTVPIYATVAAKDVEHILRETEARILFVGGQEQLDIALQAAPASDQLRHIVLFENGLRGKDERICSFADFQGQGSELQAEEHKKRLEEASPDDVANILYTSGTMDVRKGVILSHRMYQAAFAANAPLLPLGEKDVALNILPFSHIFERAWCFMGLSLGVRQAINLHPTDAQRSMREVRPTCFCAVPRFWEKVYQEVGHHLHRQPKFRRQILWGAVLYGQTYWEGYTAKLCKAPLGRRLLNGLLEVVVFRQFRRALGLSRAKFFPTAGAAVSPEIALLAHGIGLHIIVGYGLTESTATVSLDRFGMPVTLGSVGRVLENLEIKLGPDGEILLKGDTITPGYYKNPTATARAIDGDGWFHTGDAGHFCNGQLFLLDRIKDLYKTSNGKYIAPGKIEAKLTMDTFIEQVCIVAEKRKYVTALVVPQPTQLKEVATKMKWPICANHEERCRLQEANDFMLQRIRRRLAPLAHHEQVQKIILLPTPFTVENNQLTPTLKVRRRTILQHYADLIDTLYREENPKEVEEGESGTSL